MRKPSLVVGLSALLSCAPVVSPSAAVGARDGAGAEVADNAPLPGLDAAGSAAFVAGQRAFATQFSDADGVGPLFTDRSCGGCHVAGGKGPGFVGKMAALTADHVPAADQAAFFPLGQTVHPLTAAGAHTPILPPASLAAPNTLLVTRRFGPALYGRGLMEAVADQEILRMAQEQSRRTDGIAGRVNVLPFASEQVAPTAFTAAAPGQLVIGRFGLKARIGGLEEFAADAFQNDMGLTTPMRPREFANPDGLTDDGHPGIDLTQDAPNDFAQYPRLLAIPTRHDQDNGGAAVFAAAKCAVCHAPSLHTDPGYPVPALRDRDAALFTDMLIHDMGTNLADGVGEGAATGRDWRTAPLIGLRFQPTFLHDGRATSVEDAIAAHRGPGSEANASMDLFDGLDAASRAQLLTYVHGL